MDFNNLSFEEKKALVAGFFNLLGYIFLFTGMIATIFTLSIYNFLYSFGLMLVFQLIGHFQTKL